MVEYERDKHHIFHQERWYKKKPERAFRNHVGLTPMVSRPHHDDLHACVEPPLKPAPWHMERLTRELDAVPPEERIFPLWGLRMAVQYFEQQEGVRSQKIADNLARQLGILAHSSA